MAGTTPFGAIAKGAVAGLVGTLAMDLVWYQRYRKGGGEDSFTDWEFSSSTKSYDEAAAPAQVGKRVVEGVLDTELDDSTAGMMNNAVHWGTGVMWGTVHGVLAGSAAVPKIAYGLASGTLAWLASYVVLPAAGLYQPMWEYDARTLGKDWSAHLAFGLGTAAAYRLLTAGDRRPADASPAPDPA